MIKKLEKIKENLISSSEEKIKIIDNFPTTKNPKKELDLLDKYTDKISKNVSLGLEIVKKEVIRKSKIIN